MTMKVEPLINWSLAGNLNLQDDLMIKESVRTCPVWIDCTVS
jgi:hypothetical protein